MEENKRHLVFDAWDRREVGGLLVLRIERRLAALEAIAEIPIKYHSFTTTIITNIIIIISI